MMRYSFVLILLCPAVLPAAEPQVISPFARPVSKAETVAMPKVKVQCPCGACQDDCNGACNGFGCTCTSTSDIRRTLLVPVTQQPDTGDYVPDWPARSAAPYPGHWYGSTPNVNIRQASVPINNGSC